MNRHVLSAVALTALITPIAASVGCASAPVAEVPRSFDSQRAEAEVAGLSCPLCAESLIATVEGVSGVRSASLDLEAGRLMMTFGKSPPTPERIAQAVEDAGFTLVRFGAAGE